MWESQCCRSKLSLPLSPHLPCPASGSHTVGIPQMFIQELLWVKPQPVAHSQARKKCTKKLNCPSNLRQSVVICNLPFHYEGFIINIGSGFGALNLAQTFNLSVLI